MIGIMTGTISPGAVGMLLLRNVRERLNQYADSLEYLIKSKAFTKIIFCENSNYGVENLLFLQETAGKEGVLLELLSFQGDSRQVEIHGKGYGEGEIMDYIFDHSRLIKEENFFVKITGRMKIDNIRKMVSCLKTDKIYINVPNATRRDIYDTRIYAMNTEVFCNDFRKEYVNVWDDKGIYLEHIYAAVVKNRKLDVRNFPKYPRIRGISGSTGIIYDYTSWKCYIKDVLSLFNYYSFLEK